MDILQYLIALLKTRKQIGVEGLGTLYKKKTPGRYDAETHSFLPPSYVLEFTPDILENTNLAEYIQTKRGISEDSAKYFINQFVEEIQKGLQQGEYTLANLGSFTLVDNQLNFSPSQDINTGFDFFALPAVTAEVKQPEEHLTEEISEVSTESPSKVTEEPHVEQVQVPEFEHEMSKLNPTRNEVVEEKADVEEETITEVEDSKEEATPAEVYELEEELDNVTIEPAEVEKAAEVGQPKEVEKTEDATAENDVEVPAVENEPTESEVFEEITEVNTENPTNEQTSIVEEEENDAWDFDNESVVSEEDVKKEEVNEDKEIEDSKDEASIVIPTYVNDQEKTDGIKLSATTQEWDFDNIETRNNTEDNTLIGEFDNNSLEQEQEEERRGMPLYQKLSLALLVLIVVFAVLYFIKPDIFESFKRDTTNPDEKIAVPIQRSDLKTQQDSISFADSIMKNAEKAGLDVQPAKDTLKVITSKTEVKPTITYDIIIASFATNAKATEYVDRMKKKGFDAKISTMPGKRKNISIATYNHADSAEKHLAKFRKQFNNREIYAQPIKNK